LFIQIPIALLTQNVLGEQTFDGQLNHQTSVHVSSAFKHEQKFDEQGVHQTDRPIDKVVSGGWGGVERCAEEGRGGMGRDGVRGKLTHLTLCCTVSVARLTLMHAMRMCTETPDTRHQLTPDRDTDIKLLFMFSTR
jgi:hypothetical protein